MNASLHYEDSWLTVYQGDCRDVMRLMPAKSVQAVVTSPPFYGLREYGTAQWEGGDPDCEHTRVASGRGTNVPQTKNPGVDYPIAPHRGGNPNECVRCGAVRVEPTVWGGDPDHEHEWGEAIVRTRSAGGEREYGSSDRGVGRGPAVQLPSSNWCECGAWRGALGLEPTPEWYVQHLVEVFREVRRVLRDDGIVWLNLGDSYATTGGHTKQGDSSQRKGRANVSEQNALKGTIPPGLKSKDLMGVPWMAAFALREDGWYLRSDIVWSKPNAMPESVKDRPSSSHEFIFMLTKEPYYYFDMEAVKEPVGEAMIAAAKRKAIEPGREYQHDEATRFGKTSPNRVWSDPEAVKRLLAGRHMRDVLTVATKPYPGAHYAVFPPKLIEPLIKAATSEKGACRQCGAPWRRVIEEGEKVTVKGGEPHEKQYGRVMADSMDDLSGDGLVGSGFGIIETATVGWVPTCDHVGEPVPCVVLDPFGGSGTVGLVSQYLGRRAVLVDLNPKYIDQQMTRNAAVPLGL